MLKKVYTNYLQSFQGLSKEVWWLAWITLINRAGTMVVPFLSLYLTESKSFSMAEVGWIMTAFGAGSILGAYLGGFFNDRLGAYPTMVFSLFSSGIMFIILQYMDQFWSIAAMVFLVLLFADMFRPAMFVALKAYSEPKNQTRSLSLIRLAINLGFSFGPVVGGFLVYRLGYGSLFWVDGLTCFLAGILLIRVLHPTKVNPVERENDGPDSSFSAYFDLKFLFFCSGVLLFSIAFFQYFSTVPLFYREEYHLTEEYIGLLLGFNGFLVFAFEMPLIHRLEKHENKQQSYLIWGMFLLAISFVFLQFSSTVFFLWIGVVFMSFAEMLIFPMSNAYAMNRAKRGKIGQYMGLYSISFSVAHILGHTAGLQSIQAFGFTATWWLVILLSIAGMIIFWQIGLTEKQKHS